METFKILYALFKIKLNNGYTFERTTWTSIRVRPGEYEEEMLQTWLENERFFTLNELKCENVELTLDLHGIVESSDKLPDLKSRWEE